MHETPLTLIRSSFLRPLLAKNYARRARTRRPARKRRRDEFRLRLFAGCKFQDDTRSGEGLIKRGGSKNVGTKTSSSCGRETDKAGNSGCETSARLDLLSSRDPLHSRVYSPWSIYILICPSKLIRPTIGGCALSRSQEAGNVRFSSSSLLESSPFVVFRALFYGILETSGLRPAGCKLQQEIRSRELITRDKSALICRNDEINDARNHLTLVPR